MGNFNRPPAGTQIRPHTGTFSWPQTLGTALDAANVRKMFKRACKAAGIGDDWTPRELRTSFVSLMSHRGVSTEELARIARHAPTRPTEVVYRRELRPVITTGAEVMVEVFGKRPHACEPL